MDGQKELELWREGGILHDKFAQKIERLERELAECKAWGICEAAANIPAVFEWVSDIEAERDALAAQVVQMREALEYFASLKLTDGTYADKCCVAIAALALDTKPAEQIINSVKAHALREVADAIGSYVTTDLALKKRANELENK